jgi:hypothetical protein
LGNSANILPVVALWCDVPTSLLCAALCWRHVKGVIPMNFAFPRVFRGFPSISEQHDEHLLAGADEESVQALGVGQSVLARFSQNVAILCPDLVHEAQLGLGRR